jgi:hypothetical protein
MPLLPIQRMITSAPGVQPSRLCRAALSPPISSTASCRRQPLDEQLEDRAAHPGCHPLPDRDRGQCAPC